MPVFERLLKAPENFELKRFRLTGIRTELFSQFLELLNQPIYAEDADLLTIVAPLMRFIAQLPNFTQKTQELSVEAKNLREVVKKQVNLTNSSLSSYQNHSDIRLLLQNQQTQRNLQIFSTHYRMSYQS